MRHPSKLRQHRVPIRCAFACVALATLVFGCDDDAETTRQTPPPPTSTASADAQVQDAGAPAQDAAPPPPKVEYERQDLPEPDFETKSLEKQRAAMLRRMKAMGVATSEQLDLVREAMSSSRLMGQGNPAVTKHPMTQKACMDKRKKLGVRDEKKDRCAAPYMVPIYDPDTAKEDDANVCIDRYEFPGIPCEYPVTFATTKQAQAMCKAIGKRICDAHEWEGACAGRVLPVEKQYFFGRERKVMRNMANNRRTKVWAYGPEQDHTKCATGAEKSKKCFSASWKKCGSNTYPAGAFPECKSTFGVYDQHGNAAEHMALPMKEEQLGSKGGFGQAEMKGSWFIFEKHSVHEDDCRWRAPDWHANEGKNHSNYHLGFRCCKDVK